LGVQPARNEQWARLMSQWSSIMHMACVCTTISAVCNHADEQCHNGDLSVSVSDALLPLDPAVRLPPAQPANSVIVCWHRRTKRQHTNRERCPYPHHCSDGT